MIKKSIFIMIIYLIIFNLISFSFAAKTGPRKFVGTIVNDEALKVPPKGKLLLILFLKEYPKETFGIFAEDAVKNGLCTKLAKGLYQCKLKGEKVVITCNKAGDNDMADNIITDLIKFVK